MMVAKVPAINKKKKILLLVGLKDKCRNNGIKMKRTFKMKNKNKIGALNQVNKNRSSIGK